MIENEHDIPDEPTMLRTYPSTVQADIVCMRLKAEGIHALVLAFTGDGVGVDANRLLVPTREVEQAKIVLKEIEK